MNEKEAASLMPRAPRGMCAKCHLSAMCLPIGVGVFMRDLKYCEYCGYAYWRSLRYPTLMVNGVRMNLDCPGILRAIETCAREVDREGDGSLWRCYHCRDNKRQ